ncbi:MAG: Histidinol dehydrogenase [Firmicutes bacterium]|nr:Histidinol dehydrogenase [Bacillota bacterium]MDI6705543.1 histidinol dehydrogenase [Bacillota bacterium]
MRVIDLRKGGYTALSEVLDGRKGLVSGDYWEIVKRIVEEVRENGDSALLKFTLEFDGIVQPEEGLRVGKEEIEEAYAKVDGDFIGALEKAIKNIFEFHDSQREKSWFSNKQGIILGQIVNPIESVGVYVPGGTAAYPSSVLMNVIPAKVAGVKRVVMITPPGRRGIKPEVLVAADRAGADEIYRVGGAQGIAALAYGTETIKPVDKIVGPGNIYVALAKKMVYGDVGIDMIAGPSEILIIADCSARPEFVAADMISQAEHDIMASSVLITDSKQLAERVCVEINRQLDLLPRREIASKSLEDYGVIALAGSLKEACDIANSIAPEHLELMVENPMELLGRIRNAGAIFMGEFSPEPLGDYFAGPNHVLPTGGTARFSSPLSVDQFVKKSSLVYYSREALEEAAGEVLKLARVEGLDGHGRAVEVRFEDND